MRTHHSGLQFLVILSALVAALTSVRTGLAQGAGNECSTAFTAVVGANGPVSLAAMTASAAPPANEECGYLQWTATNKDAWWVFNAPTGGLLSIDFCNSDYDTSVVVFQGTCGALTRLACDDDGCQPQGPTYQSRITDLAVEPGPVYIRVSGFNGAVGTINFNLSFTQSFIVSWGRTNGADESTPDGLVAAKRVVAGLEHSAAILFGGQVACWGWNDSGQCTVPAGLNAKMVALGAEHSVALTPAGQVVCWGGNSSGQCTVPAGLVARAIGAGDYHTLAVNNVGLVVGWGLNNAGQSTPPANATARSVDGGMEHSVGVRLNFSVLCFGSDTFGQCTVPTGLTSARQVQAGGFHTVALRSDNTISCWGLNTDNQCAIPASVTTATAVAAGRFNSAALKPDGRVVYWGDASVTAVTRIPAEAQPAHSLALGIGHAVVLSSRDCNANGIADPFEGALPDCNGNGVHDCWEISLGQLEDCNGNDIPDSCEKQASVSIESPVLGPIGFHAHQIWTIPNAVHAVGNVTLRVRGHGDFSSVLESVALTWGSDPALSVLGGSADCAERTPLSWQSFMLSPESFNSGIAGDGSFRLLATPSSAVDPGLCPDGTTIEFELEYAGANSNDCDANGVIDSCQIAAGNAPDTNNNGVIDWCETPLNNCPADLNGDLVVGAQDLAVLLGAWGSANAAADIDGNGTVGAPDLAAMLGAWGVCDTN